MTAVDAALLIVFIFGFAAGLMVGVAAALFSKE